MSSNGHSQKPADRDPPPAKASTSSPLTDTKGSIFNIPNQLTIARLLLSLCFFVLLAIVARTPASSFESRSLLINISLIVFVLAVSTDFLDGYLARKWGLASTFGRIADPFVDKIVICGGFIMLIGVSPLVQPWYAVLIVFREFLVSGLRSFIESRGIAFGAGLSGKLKMVIQSITIPFVLFTEADLRSADGAVPTEPWLISGAYQFTIVLLAATMVLTLGSCVSYVRRAVAILRDRRP